MRQPRVRDNSAEKEGRVKFSPSVLPAYLRRSSSIDELLPWLYLKGISTGDFRGALQVLLGENAKGLSPNVIVGLKEKWSQEYDQWSRRDLSDNQSRISQIETKSGRDFASTASPDIQARR